MHELMFQAGVKGMSDYINYIIYIYILYKQNVVKTQLMMLTCV